MESIMSLISTLLIIGLVVVMLVGLWKIFEKAGKPGWSALIPIYNIYVLLQIVGKPAWWLILMIIPLVNIVVSVIVYIALAKSFGKSTAYGIGLVFLSFVFVPLLGFGDDEYLGPDGQGVQSQSEFF